MLRVAPYCRVSTDNEDQINSLENQVRYFTDYIKRQKDWEMVGIYVDEGITGTSVKKRKEFNRLINDAELGLIDLVITKEVSRFARNTVDTLNYTRKLSKINVGVLFLNDNIDTRDKDGEFRLTMMASFAQEESRKTSERVKWGMKRKMENGFVFAGTIYGFSIENGVLTINKDEAEIVRRIFFKYVYEGKGTSVIARELQEENALMSKRIKNWTSLTVLRILRNEKYVGDLLQKKTYTPNFLDHKSVKNDGFEEKVFILNHHEGIIDRATWDLTQEELNKRQSTRAKRSRYSNEYWCSGKIYCSQCGCVYIMKSKELQNTTYKSWACKGVVRKKTSCNNNQINHKTLEVCMQYAIKQLRLIEGELVEELQQEINRLFKSIDKKDVKTTEKKIKDLVEKKLNIIDMYICELISKEEMTSMKLKIDNQIQITENEKEQIILDNLKLNNARKNIKEIHDRIIEIVNQDVPTPILYKQVVEKIVKCPGNRINVYLKYIDIPLRIEYCINGRGENYLVDCKMV